ncbi:unnamed protein product [Durusdinium trenchii]|uniref:Uncharacterized protein n=2 Tax=Durusdinium trenchii TaxID=1381693 RepID=A0ABP0NFH0_9DINO
MIYSLFSLWKSLKPGGLYIIEDLETNYWRHGKVVYGYELKNTGIGTTAKWSAVKKIEQITQVLARHQIGAKNLTVMPGDESLCSVEWGMNIVKLRKCTPEERAFNPKMNHVICFDRKKMDAWIEEAKSTNPTV